jgi:hypothetical protein
MTGHRTRLRAFAADDQGGTSGLSGMVCCFIQSGYPFDIATCMYYTGIDPFSKQEVFVARHLRDRKLQRALLQFFKPDNYFEDRKALEEAGRTDLIGGGCEALIPAQPPKEALRARRENANQAMRGDHVHTVANPTKDKPAGERGLLNQGYRPGRKGAKRREEKKRR